MARKKKKKRAPVKKAAVKEAAVEETDAPEEAEEEAEEESSDDDDDDADEAEAEDDEDDDEEEAAAASTPEPKSHAAHAADEHHVDHRKEYWRIFGSLAVLTVLEVGVAADVIYQAIGKTALVTALVGLALTKAVLVALFFMHLKYETKVMKWTVIIPMAFPALYAFILIAEGIYRSLWGGA